MVSFYSFKSPKRKLEYYYTRVLWKNFQIGCEIEYDSNRRPFLKTGHISISHSRDIILIGYNASHPVGVDAEYISPKIKKILDKFISEEDKNLLPDLSDETITVVWSVKEAVYKMENIPGISFKENIHVKLLPESAASVEVLKNGEWYSYEFHYEIRGPFVLSCCSHASRNGIKQF